MTWQKNKGKFIAGAAIIGMLTLVASCSAWQAHEKSPSMTDWSQPILLVGLISVLGWAWLVDRT